MKVSDMFLNCEESYIYMERYVNNGSPSGYTQISTTSKDTNPFIGKDKFRLYKFKDEKYKQNFYGPKNNLIFDNYTYAHPDSLNSEILKKFDIELEKADFFVKPTASSRTVLIVDEKIKGFLKLTYDVSKIGRCDRQISQLSALASYENSNFIKKSIDDNMLPYFFAILPEKSTKITMLEKNENKYEWGIIYRDFNPYPPKNKEVVLVPTFSLFSKDYNNPADECLINQFIELSGISPQEYLTDIILKIVDCYWSLLITCGLSAEMHSQNCLVEINRKYCVNRIVLKDMEDIDRDEHISRFFSINNNWLSKEYKNFDIVDSEYKYRTSYMYDFKVGEYLLCPLIDAVCLKYNFNPRYFYSVVKDYVRENFINKIPKDYFFAGDIWYSRSIDDNGMIGKKTYIKNLNPKFR